MIPGLSANGVDITFDIVDLIDAACTESLVANASSCSSACGISVVNLTIGACADNGTADINTDDIYDINFEVNSDNPSAGQFDLFEDLILVGTYNYNELINVIGLSANGLDLNFTAIDINDPLCTVVFNTKQSPCSSCSETANFVNGDELYLDCQSSSQTVDINLSSMGIYNWTGPDSGDFYSDQLMPQFDLPGQYQLQVTHTNGCESNLTLNVIDNATRPEANAGTNKEITCYDEMVTLDGSALGNGNYSYAWYDENGDLVSTLLSPTVSQAGEYSLIITDEDNQCASLPSTVTVTEDKAEPDMDILSNSTFGR